MQLDKLDKLDMCALFSRAGSKPERGDELHVGRRVHPLHERLVQLELAADAVDDGARARATAASADCGG